MIRRSVSSWRSPGPRVPMPPWVRDRWVHSRVRRGSWYSSWASSTWRRPSWVWAWSAKMSRISRLRSMTLTLSSSSSARCWRGRQLVVGDRACRSRSRAWPRRAPRPCPCRRTSWGRRGGGSATRRRRRRRRPWWRGWPARRASPAPSSRRRRRCRRRRGRPSRWARSRSIRSIVRGIGERIAATASAERADERPDGGRRRAVGIGRGVEPGDVGFRAEPGPLALGERDVAPGVELDRRGDASARRRGRPRPRGSRSPRRPAAPGRTARGGLRASSIRPASNWARARVAIRRACDAGSTVRPSQATGPG